MNSSLSPNEQLGRMLHSFNSTAYEIDEYTFDNLKANGFLVVEDLTRKTIRWETIIFDKSGLVPNKINLLQYKAVALRFEGMIPGDKIFINDGIKRNGNTKPGYEVIIGATGSYNLDLGDNVKVTEVYFMSNSPDNIEDEDKRAQHQGQLTYAFESAAFSSFDTIKEFSLDSTPIHQFYGRYDNILNKINNIKNQLQEVYFIHAVLREEKNVFGHNPQYKTKLDPITNEAILDEEGNPVLELEKFLLFSTDAEGKYPIELNDRTATYRIYDSEANIYRYYDGYNFKYLDLTEKDIENGDKLILNDSTEIQVFNDNDFFLKETEEITSITTGYRILLEICYQVTTTVYGAEDREYGVPKVIAKLNEYDQAKALYNYLLKMGISNRETIYNAQERMEKIYDEFIEILIETLKEQEAIEGELV